MNQEEPELTDEEKQSQIRGQAFLEYTRRTGMSKAEEFAATSANDDVNNKHFVEDLKQALATRQELGILTNEDRALIKMFAESESK